MAEQAAARRAAARWRSASAVALGLLAGVGLTAGVPRLLDGDGRAPVLDADLGELAVGDLRLAREELPAGARAGSPLEAVEALLAAELTGDLDASFAYLHEPLRTELGSAAAWRAAHATLLAPVTGYDTRGSTTTGDRAQVAAVVTFEPGLDRVVGLTPARAHVVWSVVREPRGWAVDLESSEMQPVLPAEPGAAQAVRAWAEARRACRAPREHVEGLVGSPALADELCGAAGAVQVGRVEPLPDIESSPFTAAFGGDVTTWARQVAVEAPVVLRAVVAPVGDEWTVIGVL